MNAITLNHFVKVADSQTSNPNIDYTTFATNMPKQIIAIPAKKPTLYKTNTYITRRLNAQIITSKKLKKNLQINIFILPLQSQSANGALVQLVRIRACHARGQGFESPTHRKVLRDFLGLFYFL